MDLQTINTTGFLFEQTTLRLDLLHAELSDGYRAAVLAGSPAGLRTWRVKMVLPDSFDNADPIPETGETRAQYIFEFFLHSKAAGNQPFWLKDLKDKKLYLVEFVEDELSRDVLCAQLYGAGVQLRQRRLKDQESPGEAHDETNPDAI